MKTTLILRDDLVRRAKARAALRGQPLSRYVEESLEKVLQEDDAIGTDLKDWLDGLPRVSSQAANHLKKVFDDDSFREIDPEMWK